VVALFASELTNVGVTKNPMNEKLGSKRKAEEEVRFLYTVPTICNIFLCINSQFFCSIL